MLYVDALLNGSILLGIQEPDTIISAIRTLSLHATAWGLYVTA